MKKKLLTLLLSIAAMVSCLFAFSACSPEEHEHFYTRAITKNATCTEKGEWTHTCACGDGYTEEIPATGVHTWDEGEVTTEPTCTEEGVKTFTCTICQTATKTESIDKLPHEHAEKWTSNATHHWHECKCGDKDGEEKHTAGAPATATTPQICTVCGYVLQAETGILFNTLTVEGTNVYGKVSNATTEFSFIDEVTVKGNAKYVVALDKNVMQTVITKTVTLQEGDNTIYVFETNGDEIVNTYVIIIRRRLMYEVTFDANGGTAVEKQVIEEEYLATEPETTRTGYTFTGWDYDFTQAITQNTKITASWSANTDTKYTVNYYLQNLDDDNYTLHESVELKGETDTTAMADIKEYTHFTFNQGYYYNKLSGNINGDGGQVLSVYYTRDSYKIVVNNNNAKAGTSTSVNGTYKYDKEFTLTATTNAGYTWLGWYDGETLACEVEEFTFIAEKDVTYTATWSVKSEMSNFNFTSTATSCQITGVKDKTITEIVIPDSVTTIGSEAFRGCSSLTSIKVSENNTVYQSIDGNLYSKDGKTLIQYAIGKTATSFTIPDSVTTIGGYAFYGCSSLTSVVIGDSVTSIGERAFCNCYSLTSVEIGDSVTSIGDYAFSNCTSLTSVVIGGSVTTIGDEAFYYCDSLTSVYITDIAAWCNISFGDYRANPLYYAKNLYLNNQLVTELIIPDSVTSIGDEAFFACDSLTSVEIGDSVTLIGVDAFSSCTNLKSITIPDSVTSIGAGAFDYCTSLTSVEIGDSVTLIGSSAFYKCSSLTSVVIPDSVTTIGDRAFCSCDSLTSVVIGDSVTSIGEYAFYNCDGLTSITIPDSVTSIGDCAFYDCYSLTSVVIGDSVTTIGASAFEDCSSLTSIMVSENNTVYQSIDGNLYSKDGKTLIQYAIGKTATSFTIPGSVTSIGDSAFYYCRSLTSVVIPNSVTSIGDRAFYYCTSLTSVVIPDSVTSIGNYAFYYCRSLTSIKYRGTQAEWNAISKGYNWNYSTGYTITYNYQG